ncbi:hypothetical protein CB1_000667028 [Camelus ferus]|nr:hypothetical protein CB1_000667028 [Camelus ferus]
MQRWEEMGLDASEGGEKIQKWVSFSEKLFMEEEVEEAPALIHRDRGDPQGPIREGAVPGNMWDAGESQEREPGPASLAGRPPLLSSQGAFSEGPTRSASSGRDSPLFRTERDDTWMARNQSKASDHEGLLPDPPCSLQSTCEMKPPVMAHLDLTLPSIPEVASDDERVDQDEDNRGPAKVAALGGGASSPSTLPTRPEMEKGPSGEASRSAESLQDPRPHPVKPMNTTATKVANSSLGTATIISENLINEAIMKKYKPSDPAFAYAQLTHDELIQLVLRQKETISKKESQVRQLEDYIDNLLVRVMEETPNILRVPSQVGKKAGKILEMILPQEFSVSAASDSPTRCSWELNRKNSGLMIRISHLDRSRCQQISALIQPSPGTQHSNSLRARHKFCTMAKVNIRYEREAENLRFS